VKVNCYILLIEVGEYQSGARGEKMATRSRPDDVDEEKTEKGVKSLQ